jgi:hypothetical protein
MLVNQKKGLFILSGTELRRSELNITEQQHGWHGLR